MDGDISRVLILGQGGGGGRKGGGAAPSRGSDRVPVEEPNTLKSKATARVVDLLGEGEIWGLRDGLQSVFYDETAFQNADGSYNFPSVYIDARTGTPTQTYIEGFPTEVTLTTTGGEFRNDLTWERQITDLTLDAVRIIIRVPQLTLQDQQTGDLRGTSVDLQIDVRPATGGYTNVVNQTIEGKCISLYERGYRINLPKPAPPGGWFIRVRRTTPASTANIRRDTFVGSITGLIDTKFSYPNSALIAHRFDASVFGGSIPKRSYRVRGLKVQIPNVYDPWSRLYASPTWSGVFGYEWTNNPAWIYYDLLTNRRYGLGDFVLPSQVAVFELFEIAKYCDAYNARPWNPNNDYGPNGKHGVPDGRGGYEPRFTFNGIINTRREAYQVLQSLASVFRGMTYWGTGTVVPVQDRPGDVIHTVTQANVKDGMFNYQSSSLKDRATVCQVTFNDPDDFFRPAVETVENTEAINTYGYRVREITAFGCTSRTEAHRLGKWSLDTDWNEGEMVNYTTSLDHILARPGQMAAIADPVTTGDRLGGRLADYDDQCIAPLNQNLIIEPVFERLSLDTRTRAGVTLPSNRGRWQIDTGTAQPVINLVPDERWRTALTCYERRTNLGQRDLDTGRRTQLFGNPRAEGTGGTPLTGGNMPTSWQAILGTNGLTATVLGVSTVLGMPAWRVRISGTTATTGFLSFHWDGPLNSILAGDSLVGSVYVTRVAGTRNGINRERMQLQAMNASFGNVTNSIVNVSGGVPAGPLDTQRYSASVTNIGAAAVRPRLFFQLDFTAAGQAVDITYDIAYPQIEWGVTTPGTLLLPPVGQQRLVSVGSNFSGFEVLPGETIFGSFWGAQGSGTTSPVQLGLLFYDHRNQIVGGAVQPVATVAQAASGWTFASGSVTVPALAVRAVPSIFRSGIADGSATVSVNAALVTSLYLGRAAAYAFNGVDRVLKLDSPVTLGGSDEIMMPRRVGGIMTAPIFYAAGPQQYLYLGAGLPDRPLTGQNLIVSAGNARPRKFRIFQVREASPSEFDVVATEHDETKYLRVEFDYQLPRPVTTRLSTGPINPPTNFAWQESLYRGNSGNVMTRLTLSWESSKDQNGRTDVRVTAYNVDIRWPSGVWERVTTTTQTSIELPDVQPGAYQVRLTAQSLLGSSPAFVSSAFVVLGKTAPPGNVQNFVLTPQLSGVLLSWDEVTDIDLVGYEIREGADWNTAIIVTAALKATKFFVPLNDTVVRTFLIRAKDDTGNYSSSSASVIGRVATPANVPSLNAVPQVEGVVLTWEAVPGVDVEYEIRVGSIWDFGLILARVNGTTYVSLYPGAGLETFWVKAVSKLGLYSETPTFAQCILNNPAFRNVVVSTNYKTGNFAVGQRTNCAFEAATNSLAAQTNLYQNPTNFLSASWTRDGGTVTANAATAPDGSNTASRYTENTTANANHTISQRPGGFNGYTYRLSAEVKAGTGSTSRWVMLIFTTEAFGGVWAIFDHRTGTVTARSATTVLATVEVLSNGWFRISVTTQATSSNVLGGAELKVGTSATNPANAIYTGDGTSNFLVNRMTMEIIGLPVYAEYFIDVTLADRFRARNWIDSDFGLLDANNITWATASFTWASDEAKKVSWISSGDDVGARAERTISLRRTGAIPSEMIFGAEMNGAVTDVRGSANTYNVGTTYAPHVVRQGYRPAAGAGNGLIWTLATPTTFAFRFTARVFPPNNNDVIIGLRNATPSRQASLVRYASGIIQAFFTDGFHVQINDFPVIPEDIVTYAVVQTTTKRIVAAYSHRQKLYRVAERTTSAAPAGTYDQIAAGNFNSTISLPIIGNIEVYSTTREGAALVDFCETGLAPVGYLPFTPFVPGDYDYQQAILGVQMATPAGTGRPALTDYIHTVDVVDVNEQRDVTVTAGWVAFTFNKTFSVPPTVAFYQRGGAATVAVGETRNITKTGFEGRLVNTSNAAVAGNATFIAVGY